MRPIRSHATVVLNTFSWFASTGLVLAGSLLPALWVGMLVHAIRAWQVLGAWPSYNRPDPKDLPGWLVEDRIEILAIAVATVCLVGAGLSILRKVGNPGRRTLAAGAIAIGLGLVGLGAWWLDPGGIVEWYAD